MNKPSKLQQWLWVGSVMVVVAAACSSDGNDAVPADRAEVAPTEVALAPTVEPAPSAAPTPATAPSPVVTEPAAEDDREPTLDDTGPRADVQFLADDAQQGRDDGTAGSENSRQYIVDQIATFAVGIVEGESDLSSYEQPFDDGVNVIGIFPGTDLADEYVVVGAHYDHLGTNCLSLEADDSVCNGATDNATGVAAVIQIGRNIAASDVPPRRSILLAFWDSEEDGLLGSEYYLENPTVPVSALVAYINFDIVGANLLPSLRATSFAIGAETGGEQFQAVVADGIESAPLGTRQLSSLFGQGRSDYFNFIDEKIPTVFFSDATGPCYHTTGDDIDIVDFAKLDEQIAIAGRVVTGLAGTDTTLRFVGDSPVVTFEDAVVLNELNQAALTDIDRFEPSRQKTLTDNAAVLAAIVAAGPDGFGDLEAGTLLAGAAELVDLLTTGKCDGFLDGSS